MKTILVPVDLSAEATGVCDAACELARLMGAKLLLFHAVQPPPVIMAEIHALDTGQAEEMLVAAKRAGADRLRALAERCAGKGVSVRGLHRVGLPVPAAEAPGSLTMKLLEAIYRRRATRDFSSPAVTPGVGRDLLAAPGIVAWHWAGPGGVP
jgi:hypothetical protein